MATSTRTIFSGSRELLWARITDRNGNNLRNTRVMMAVVPQGSRPIYSDWKPPAEVSYSGRIIRAGYLFTAPADPSSFEVYARCVDSFEDILVNCGSFRVV